jgi:hypothetical protein
MTKMNHYEIMIALLIGALLFTVFLLQDAIKESMRWQAAWTRDAKELLYWKRNALLRDPETGRYHKQGES